jgi:hypothetical protein
MNLLLHLCILRDGIKFTRPHVGKSLLAKNRQSTFPQVSAPV